MEGGNYLACFVDPKGNSRYFFLSSAMTSQLLLKRFNLKVELVQIFQKYSILLCWDTKPVYTQIQLSGAVASQSTTTRGRTLTGKDRLADLADD